MNRAFASLERQATGQYHQRQSGQTTQHLGEAKGEAYANLAMRLITRFI